jgi:SAM-dependent methyltransferase
LHQSAHDHMDRLVAHYLRPDVHYRVVDLGSRISGRQKMTHRDLFAGHSCTIIGVDIAPGRNVDLVMKKPYRLPMKSNSADVVISGQAFEHIPFFWASLLEITRVLKPNGLVFLTAPSRGHVHTAVDCWRYYPDGLRAMATFAGLDVLEAHTDFPPIIGKRQHDYSAIDTTYRYWGDSVGVFRKPARHPRVTSAVVREVVVWWANRVSGVRTESAR